MLCEAINIRDVLSRAANFQKELGIVADPSPKYALSMPYSLRFSRQPLPSTRSPIVSRRAASFLPIWLTISDSARNLPSWTTR